MKPNLSRPLLRAFSAGGLFLLSLTVMTTLAEAQMPTAGPPDRTEIINVAGQLDLNATQQNAFVRIVDDFQMSVETTLEHYGVDPRESRPPPTVLVALRSDLQKSLSQMDAELSAILTTDQMREFRRIRRGRMQGL